MQLPAKQLTWVTGSSGSNPDLSAIFISPKREAVLSNRNLSIDIFRGLAILFITVYHVSLFLGHPVKYFHSIDLYAPFKNGMIGVPLFIFISGYITHRTASQMPAMEFIQKRLTRIIIPYYIALLFWDGLILLHMISGSSHLLRDNIYHVFFVHNLFPDTFFSISGVFWYLGLQVQLYLLYLVFRNALATTWLFWIVILFFSCVGTNLLSPVFFEKSVCTVLTHSVFSYLFIFIFGVVICEKEAEVSTFLKRPYIIVCLAMTVLMGLFLKISWMDSGELKPIGLGIVLGLIMLGMPKINEQNLLWNSLLSIGAASYSIYLYNLIFYVYAPVLKGIEGLGMYSLMTIFFGMGMYHLIEKPLLDKWKRRKTA